MIDALRIWLLVGAVCAWFGVERANKWLDEGQCRRALRWSRFPLLFVAMIFAIATTPAAALCGVVAGILRKPGR